MPTLADHIESPCWLDAADAFWWPCGVIDRTTSKGEQIYGALVLVAASDVQLLVVPLHSTIEAKAGDYPHPRHAKRDQVRLGYELAEAILSGEPFVIEYQGSKDLEPRERRLDRAVPNSKGTSIYADDLDKGAPRQFRLDRIGWVRAAE